jgi:hypothetical protein
MAASDVAAARAAYQHAGELARRIGWPEALARAALGLGLVVTGGVVDPDEVGLLEEALVALGGADSPLRARVLARLAKALVFTPQTQRRLQLSEEAVALARRLGDPATLAAVLYDHHQAIWGAEQAEMADERLAVATEVVSLAERTARELRQLHYRWQLPLARATRALLAGSFAQAEELAAEALAIGRRAGDQVVEFYYHAGAIAVLRFLQGRGGETVELFQDLAARFPTMTLFRTCLTAALTEAGRTAEAQAEVERLVGGDLAALPRTQGGAGAWPRWRLPATASATPSAPPGCASCWSRMPTATSSSPASAPTAWARPATTWDCWTSPSANPSRPCAASSMRPRWPADSRPARWSP